MTETLKNNIGRVSGKERQLFYALVSLIAVVAFMYGYFVRDTVMNVVAREKMSRDTRVIMSEISDLETAYLQSTNGITLQYAYDHGFKDAPKADYITEKADTRGLSLVNKGN